MKWTASFSSKSLHRTIHLVLLGTIVMISIGCSGTPNSNPVNTEPVGEESVPPLFSARWNEARDRVQVMTEDSTQCNMVATLRLDHDRPCLFPLYSPGGEMVLRRFPLENPGTGESTDHPHHAGVWIAHGSVDDHDFWHGKSTRQIPSNWESFSLDDDNILVLSGQLTWTAGDDAIIEETRTYDFRRGEGFHSIEIWSLWEALGSETITIGDTKEGTFALRLAPSLRLDGQVAAGNSINAEGISGGSVWGKQSRWVAYSGPVEGQEVTVALLDHPENPGHPTWWHARKYGLFAANPFGQHDFEGSAAGSGEMKIPPGEQLFFRHMLLIFSEDVSAEQIDEAWARFSAG